MQRSSSEFFGFYVVEPFRFPTSAALSERFAPNDDHLHGRMMGTDLGGREWVGNVSWLTAGESVAGQLVLAYSLAQWAQFGLSSRMSRDCILARSRPLKGPQRKWIARTWFSR